jgi:hypothetical protein
MGFSSGIKTVNFSRILSRGGTLFVLPEASLFCVCACSDSESLYTLIAGDFSRGLDEDAFPFDAFSCVLLCAWSESEARLLNAVDS